MMRHYCNTFSETNEESFIFENKNETDLLEFGVVGDSVYVSISGVDDYRMQ